MSVFALMGCQTNRVGKPPLCPRYTDAAWLELKTLIESEDYPALVNRSKRAERHCRAIKVMQ